MANTRKFTCAQVIAAIEGTGGIKTVIAGRLGCHRHTVDRYIRKHPTVRRAFQQECATVGDFAETVLTTNIRLAAMVQQREAKKREDGLTTDVTLVDSSDAKWYLERKRAGYSRKVEAWLNNLDMNALTIEQLERISAGEDPIVVITSPGQG